MTGAPIRAAVVAEITAAGLAWRGGFHVREGDDVPALADGGRARTVLLAGNAGPAMWRAFRRNRPDGPDPLDSWSRSVLSEIATRHGATVVMPSDGPPYAPFQRWAIRAEPVYPSPLGILIHPRWGLWHGYRGALLFRERLDLPAHADLASPCETCADKPCLSACPVGAFTVTGYDADGCAAHLGQPAGRDCLAGGCLARRACPVGANQRYEPEQAAFHMAAFLAPRS